MKEVEFPDVHTPTDCCARNENRFQNSLSRTSVLTYPHPAGARQKTRRNPRSFEDRIAVHRTYKTEEGFLIFRTGKPDMIVLSFYTITFRLENFIVGVETRLLTIRSLPIWVN